MQNSGFTPFGINIGNNLQQNTQKTKPILERQSLNDSDRTVQKALNNAVEYTQVKLQKQVMNDKILSDLQKMGFIKPVTSDKLKSYLA
jgi:hypothetical protein